MSGPGTPSPQYRLQDRLNRSPQRELTAALLGVLAFLLEWRGADVLDNAPFTLPLFVVSISGLLTGTGGALVTLLLSLGGLFLVATLHQDQLQVPVIGWLLGIAAGAVFGTIAGRLRRLYRRLEEARAGAEEARRMNELLALRRAAIVRFSQSALGWRDPERVCLEAALLAGRLLDADAALVLDEPLRPPRALLLRVGLGVQEAAKAELLIALDGPWSRALLEHTAVAFGPDAPGLSQLAPLVAPGEITAGACAAIDGREEVRGLLAVLATRQRAFDRADLICLEELARTLGDALARLRFEAQLGEQLAFSRAVASGVREGIVALDAEGRVTFTNQAAAELLGWEEQELVGRQLHALVDCSVPSGEPLCPLELGRGGRAAVVDRDDVRLRRKDGREIIARLQCAPLVRGDDRPGAVVLLEDVTQRIHARDERRRLLEALSRERALLRAVLAQMPAPVLVVEQGSGRVLVSNDAMNQFILGVKEGEPVTRAWQLRRPDGTLYPYEQMPLVRALGRGESISAEELELQAANGSWRTLLLNAGPVRDEEGRVVAAVAAALDITRRKATERALREIEERYALAIRATRDILYDWDIATGRVVWNEALGLLGYAPPAAGFDIGWWEEQIHPDDLPRVLKGVERVLAEGADDWTVEYRFRGADGFYRTIFDRGYLARDRSGRAVRMIGTMVDVTAQKRREEVQRLLARASTALAASLERDEVLSSLAVLLADQIADGCIIDVVESEGQPPRPVAVACADEALARRVRQALASSDDRARAHAAERTLEEGGAILVPPPHAQECRPLVGPYHPPLFVALGVCSYLSVPLRSGGRLVGALTLWQSGSGRRLSPDDLQLAEDLASRAASAVENARLYREAQAAAHARERFLSVASHELRTPLTVLHLQLQRAHLLSRKLARTDPAVDGVVRLLDKAEDQSERVARLVGELLDVSRLAAGKLRLQPARIDLGALVAAVAEALRPEASAAGCSVALSLQRGVEGVWDELRVEQVVTNLLSNAFKYGKGRPVAVRLRREAGEAVLEVQDQGIGITPEDLQRIFEPFERAVAERSFSGAGLGLYISRQIVQAHGGRLQVQSAPGEGATFVLRLPLQPVQQREAEERVLH